MWIESSRFIEDDCIADRFDGHGPEVSTYIYNGSQFDTHAAPLIVAYQQYVDANEILRSRWQPCC